jgi:hypothetical protein
MRADLLMFQHGVQGGPKLYGPQGKLPVGKQHAHVFGIVVVMRRGDDDKAPACQ